jgi:class 3 adenylate cyclase
MEDPDVTAWLAGLGLERYGAAFGEAQVDFATLPELTVADLRELGVNAVGPRRRLETAIARLRVERATPDEGPAFVEARQHLTILFCDLVGSTALSRRCDAEQMSVMFREYYSVVTRVVKRRGEHEANRLGDGSLILFGYPHPHEQAALGAVLTAREILDEAARLVTDPEGTPISVRAGVASGMVVLNHADTKDVFGDTPNIAARVRPTPASRYHANACARPRRT